MGEHNQERLHTQAAIYAVVNGVLWNLSVLKGQGKYAGFNGRKPVVWGTNFLRNLLVELTVYVIVFQFQGGTGPGLEPLPRNHATQIQLLSRHWSLQLKYSTTLHCFLVTIIYIYIYNIIIYIYIEIALMIVPPLLEYTQLLFFFIAQSPHWLRLYCTAWVKPTCRVYFLRTQRVLSPSSSMDQNDDLDSMVPRGYIHQVAAGKHQKHRKLMCGWEYQKSFHCFFGKFLHATSMFFFPFP